MSAPKPPVANAPAPGAEKNTVYVNFCAEIVPHTTESLMATVSNLVNQRIERIYLLLSTPGGSVMHGMTLYNFFRSIPCELVIHNAGSVNSIGNVIFLSAEKERRYACAHSTFMFHGVGFDVPPGTRAEEKFLRERLDSVLSDQNRIGQILQERTQITSEQAKALFREAQTKDVAYAVGCGIVHEVRDIQIPVGGPVVSLVFKR